MAKNLIALALLWIVASADGLAQTLIDPLRPSGAPAGALEAADHQGAVGPQLQSVIRGGGRRPAALLNGELVEQGKAWREYRLVKVAEASVVLDGPNGRETIALNPAVQIVPSRPPATDKAKRTRGAKVSAGSAP